MILVVGAGFAGSVAARELADNGKQVHVVDKRPHIGGNAYDELDDNGVLVHRYGPHIFHTNSDKIFAHLSRFTEWRHYEHRVRSFVDGELYSFPINRDTVNRMYGLNLTTDSECDAFFMKSRIYHKHPTNSEELVLNTVGPDLYEKFFRNYTIKQWGIDPKNLKAGVTARIPVRTNTDDRYFGDKHQVMPEKGYTPMFKRMLCHDNITVFLQQDYSSLALDSYEHIVYTGPIDEFFAYCFGRLPYRSLDFKHKYIQNKEYVQEVGTINYPNDHDYTRITEFKHLTGQVCEGTSLMYEYPKDCTEDSIPYYPVPSDDSEALYKKYESLVNQLPRVTFVGRLAQYRYYNMDQVVGAALTAVERILKHLESDNESI